MALASFNHTGLAYSFVKQVDILNSSSVLNFCGPMKYLVAVMVCKFHRFEPVKCKNNNNKIT